MLLTLLKEADGIVPAVIDKIGDTRTQLTTTVESEIERLPSSNSSSQAAVSRSLQQVFEAAAKSAGTMNDEFVSTEHLLIALTEVDGPAKRLLFASAVEAKSVRDALKQVRGSARVTDQNPEAKYQSLEKFCVDLVAAAEAGKLDPVIGRDEEIRRVIQVLSRRSKNNPVLIGQPGVGKTAIAEGLALRIVKSIKI